MYPSLTPGMLAAIRANGSVRKHLEDSPFSEIVRNGSEHINAGRKVVVATLRGLKTCLVYSYEVDKELEILDPRLIGVWSYGEKVRAIDPNTFVQSDEMRELIATSIPKRKKILELDAYYTLPDFFLKAMIVGVIAYVAYWAAETFNSPYTVLITSAVAVFGFIWLLNTRTKARVRFEASLTSDKTLRALNEAAAESPAQ